MSVNALTWHLDTCVDGAVTVGAASTLALAANGQRANAIFINDSDQVIYLARGHAAVLNDGIRLNANGGSYEMMVDNMFRGAVYAICVGGQANLCVCEGI